MGQDSMRSFWYWLAGIALLIIVVVAAITLTNFFWPRVQDPTTASAASAMGSLYGAGIGLLSAVASAGAAIAAFMAAKKSDETAQRAGEALGLAMKPALTAHIMRVSYNPGSSIGREALELEVKNLSAWPAADVKIYASDRRFRPIAEIDYLPAAEQPNYTIKAEPGVVTIDVTDAPIANKPGFGNLLIVDYSDERRILRWRQTINSADTFSSEEERVR